MAPPGLGVLNVNKPGGITSFDVVRKVRRASGIKRVGHAGTLDPLATGVLLVCLGQATRIISYLQEAPKVYLAGLRLGQRTTTYDAEGALTEELPVPERLELDHFVGDVWQTPPVYSALKREGRRLYDYARKGQEVELQPRLVHIERIELASWEPPRASLRVWCSKGTYIRSLANDLGGHLTSLVREAVGSFSVDQAIGLEQLDAWENYLMPIAAALPHLPRLAVEPAQADRLRNGLPVDGPAGEAIALDGCNEAVALLRDGRPHIVFSATGAS
jgi:tRNA pseudouridine55 synthase